MTIKEFIESKDFYRVEISKLEGFGEIYIELEDLIKEIVVIKLQEQRQICADNVRHANEGEDDFDYDYMIISKDSILNASTPEI